MNIYKCVYVYVHVTIVMREELMNQRGNGMKWEEALSVEGREKLYKCSSHVWNSQNKFF